MARSSVGVKCVTCFFLFLPLFVFFFKYRNNNGNKLFSFINASL